jgi:hypothetical protein
MNRVKRFYCIASLLICCSIFNFTVQSQSLKVPFYDDFSRPGLLTPDSTLWLPSGVTLNNSYAINPPTQFVATFDGRNKFGRPYNSATNNAFGETDSLTSHPIELSDFTVKDSLILSFFLQPKGLGDLPDPEDSLIVRFRNRKLEWVDVWKNDSVKAKPQFEQIFLTIRDSAFFHDKFQVAFITKGRQSGPFDAWHLDYVFLEMQSKRLPQRGFYTDIAVQNIPSSILKYYRSMPMRQFRANADNEIADSLTVNILNLRPTNQGDLLESKWVVNESITGNNILNAKATNLQFYTGQLTNKFRLPKLNIPTTSKAILSYGFKIFSTDFQSAFVDGVDFTRNDSLFVTSELNDFYAYDDGTAEVGADVDLRLGSVAVQFVLNQPDTLGAVRINFTPYFRNQTGSDFLLQVFSNKNGKPDKAIIQQTIKVAYPATLNGFIEYELDKSIAVTDTFYVGWSRLSDQSIAIGFDKNSPQFSDKIFYNLGSEWQTNRSRNGINRINGSFMLRPVMGFRSNGSNTENERPLAIEPLYRDNLIVFPNPASQKISWGKKGEFVAQIFELSGRLLLEERTNQGYLNVSGLSSGTYLLRLSNAKESCSKKIILLN